MRGFGDGGKRVAGADDADADVGGEEEEECDEEWMQQEAADLAMCEAKLAALCQAINTAALEVGRHL